MRKLVHIFVAMLGGLVSGVAAAEVLIDFEVPVVAVSETAIPGSTYSALGVTLSTVLRSGNAEPVVGGTTSLSPVNANVLMYRGANAFSGEQFIGPNFGGGENDLLMHFSTPITKVSIVSDQTTFEIAQTIRLIALANLGLDYEVLGFVAASDDAIGLSTSLLELDLGAISFSDVLFEVTTEQEGFDDLRFTTVAQVPEPAPLPLLIAVTLLLAGTTRLKRSLSRPDR